MRYVATFHTHLSALRSQKKLTESGVQARLAPVPRKLSASCGTCVLYTADDPLLSCMDADVECVYGMSGEEEYFLIKNYE